MDFRKNNLLSAVTTVTHRLLMSDIPSAGALQVTLSCYNILWQSVPSSDNAERPGVFNGSQ